MLGSAAPPVLGKTLGRRFAEPLAWAAGQIFAPTQKFAPIVKDRQRTKYINEADFGVFFKSL